MCRPVSGYTVGVIVLVVAMLAGCSPTKFLEEDEYLVKRNRIELIDSASVEGWNAMQIEMGRQVVTQPNGNFLFFAPREFFFLRNEVRQDSTRFNSFVQRIIAEEPAYLDSEDTDQSVARLRAYMLNRGYFNASVSAEVDTTGDHSARVRYVVSPGNAYRYSTVQYSTRNRGINRLLEETRENRILKEGGRVDSRDYDRESLRIVNLLRDNGYANFFANSISPLEADSVGFDVRAELAILPPTDSTTHQTYRVGTVTVFPDVDPLATSTTVSIDTSQSGLRFIFSELEPAVNIETLISNIFIRPGQLYRQSDINKTNLQLNNLGVFRTVSVQQLPSLDDENTIDFSLQLTQRNEWEIGGGAEVNFTDRPAVTSGRLALIGGELSGSLVNNNLRGGAERLSASVSGGVEFNFADIGNTEIQRLNTVELGASVQYGLPRFIDYFGLYRNLNRVKSGEQADGTPDHFINDKFYAALRERATTQLTASVNYVDLLNFYQTSTFSSTFGYEVRPNPTDRYIINHVGLDYLRVRPDSTFAQILETTPFLQNSFSDQVFSAFLFRNISFSRVTASNGARPRWTLLADFEQSGFEVFIANKIRNSAADREDVFQLNSGLDYARYVRGQGSIALTLPLTQRQTFAARGLVGTAVTFGFDRRTQAVPYVRQFFGGGNNSLRGWNARAVGPGSYRDSLALDTRNIANYQQADFQLELNAEFRSFLTNVSTTVIEGAIFIDAGNIWTLREDPTRPGSQFRFTEGEPTETGFVAQPFYKQVAINTGAGLRWDIGYVLLRMDIGVKLRNPYKIDGTYFPSSFAEDGGRISYAIGLNYPF